MPDKMPHGSPWPRISIVTPSVNQGQYIEETIRSVLLQGYPDLEYIIIDGGSTDGSVEIIQKYEKWLTYWISEPDKGQSHAINKGFAHAGGLVYAYLNSDDIYEPEALKTIAPFFGPEKLIQFIAGACAFIQGAVVEEISKATWPDSLTFFLHPLAACFAQPATFWSRQIYRRLGGFDETLNYCFDREFFLRLGLSGISPELIPNRLARYRVHEATKFKSQLLRFYDESLTVVLKHGESLGLSQSERRDRLREILKEKDYKEVFITWKRAGRISALEKLVVILIRNPSGVFERRMLGLARRLLTFRQNEVEELKKF